jgi:hypothetical protein
VGDVPTLVGTDTVRRSGGVLALETDICSPLCGDVGVLVRVTGLADLMDTGFVLDLFAAVSAGPVKIVGTVSVGELGVGILGLALGLGRVLT